MTNSAIQSMRSIDRFLQEVAVTEKRAAEANTEPGSIGGPTSHPVKDVDDSTEDAKEGERSAENTADVKADQGKPSVDSTPENVSAKKAVDGKSESGSINPPGTASGDQLQIGTKKEPTGEDPAVETSSAKAEKEDDAGGRLGKTKHPARTNNSELDGYKYAEMPLDQLAKVAADMGNNLLAELANLQKQAEAAPATAPAKPTESKEAADLAGQAGWELAGLLSGDFDKKAADTLVQRTLEEIIKTASEDADKVAEFLSVYQEELQKRAEGEMPPGGDPAAMMGGGAPLMGGGADMAGAMMGGGAPPMGGGEGGGGGGAVEQLAALLEQLGITPEELEAAMAGGGAGGDAGGGAPPGAGAPAEEAPPEVAGDGDADDSAGAAPGMEVEASAKGHGKQAAAKKGAASKSVREYVQEILERSRR